MCVCACVCTCMCVHVMYDHMCMKAYTAIHICRCQKRIPVSSSITLHNINFFFEAHSLPGPKAYLSVCLIDQPAPAICLSPYLSTGVPGTAVPSLRSACISQHWCSRYSHVPLLHGCWGFKLSDFWFYTKLYCPLSSLLEPTIEFCRPSSFPLLYRYRNFPRVSQLMVKLGLLFPIATFVLSVSIYILKHKLPELCLLKNL